ncbi:HesA/MoeB/ThiF family protein [Actinokineospora sp. HBU206404]|uniref:HesA/MoeB/ThiF family protein n=1 Tax=Actinokineospora xionganensis TaxID=2684470 RepID=A0ABR7L0I7_9PSEU|nr:HesA/MoeB/ThiF family protein [Actinokineospora xionganensis]
MGIAGFGEDGQAKLSSAHVAISRTGGVGGTVAMHLARAGVGSLTMAHGGFIEPEGLNRWPWAFVDDIGKPSVHTHAANLQRVNPDVAVTAIHSNVTAENVATITASADVIVDAAPLFEERYLLNREAVRRGVPLVSGAMYDMECCVTVVIPGQTPCFACINPVKPDYWQDIYVFAAIGPGPATVGAVMAMEVIKLVAGIGESLTGKLWFFDMATNVSRLINVARRPDCDVCGHL